MTVHPDGELLQALQHEGALRRLARALLRNPADADDAVEHALAQEATGRRLAGTPLWAFLRMALQRRAANLHKMARRRASRERVAARPELVPAADEIVQRDQLRRRVADAVLALDEPYRTTVWLRWFEDLSTGAVAKQMAVPTATVRTRLQRAHGQLRQRLDREYGDRRWAVLALPAGGAVIAFPTTLAAMFAMKKTLLAVVVLLLVCGFLFVAPWSDGPATSPTVAAKGTGGRPANAGDVDAAQRTQVAVAAPAGTAAARSVRVVHADGSAAASLPVWFWTEAVRPLWAQRIDPAQVSEQWTAGMGPAREGDPPVAERFTDRDGRVGIPDGHTAITVACADRLWFSASLPDDVVVLPELAPVSVTLLDGPADGTAEGSLEIAWRTANGEDTFGNACENVTTRSGDGVMRFCQRHFRFRAAEPLDLLVPVGHEVVCSAWGHGFHVEPTEARAQVPGSVTFRGGRLLPGLTVKVLEHDDTPTQAHGHVRVQGYVPYHEVADLEQGVATFDINEFRPGRRWVDVVMADGELLHADAEQGTTGDTQVVLRRGTGLLPLRVRLPETPVLAAIAEVWFERAGQPAVSCVPFTNGYFRHPVEYGFDTSPGELLFNVPPPPGAVCRLIANDLRVARFVAGLAGETVEGSWLPSAPSEAIDVAEYYRSNGDLPAMQARVELELHGTDGPSDWRTILNHVRFPRNDHATPPPVWRDLRLPLAMRTRLVIQGGRTLSDWAPLRVIDLTPR